MILTSHDSKSSPKGKARINISESLSMFATFREQACQRQSWQELSLGVSRSNFEKEFVGSPLATSLWAQQRASSGGERDHAMPSIGGPPPWSIAERG